MIANVKTLGFTRLVKQMSPEMLQGSLMGGNSGACFRGLLNSASRLWIGEDALKAGETLFGQDPKNSNELLVTRSKNSLSDRSRHFLAELDFVLPDIDPADDGTSAQGFIEREHEPDLKRCATAVTG